MQFHSVRGARGVQTEEVWAAADAVLAQGERPTIERVRQQLGRGSPNTVGPMLDGWYGSLAKRLGTGPVEDAGAGAEGGQARIRPVLAHKLFSYFGLLLYSSPTFNLSAVVFPAVQSTSPIPAA